MPQQEGHKRRTLEDVTFTPNPPSPYVELGLASCFSFLHAASDAVDLSVTANMLGYDTIGIADRNTLAGVVRMHVEAGKACVKPPMPACPRCCHTARCKTRKAAGKTRAKRI